MIDIWTEPTMTLAEAAEALGAMMGKPVTAHALYRWARLGVSGVVLETVIVAGVKRTSKRALAEFCDRWATARAVRAAPASPPAAAPVAPAAAV